MPERQTCFVCNTAGMVALEPIFVDPDARERNGLVAQCPRCRRWLCSLHGEPLLPSGVKTFFSRRREPVALGCPFDCDVVLSSEDTG